MPLKLWMLDVAREQFPTTDHLRAYCRLSVESGYDGIGLYLEHRFAYPSSPWAHGKGCVTPEMIAVLRAEFPGLRIIPFINLLGHFEGMLYSEGGQRFREAQFQGLQACPLSSDFVRLCRSLIDDTLAAFDDEIVHIGGDETAQLGQCPLCESFVSAAAGDGKAELYGAHFGPLAKYVEESGRRPAVWGDMFLEHPAALDHMPQSTLIFDWQYFGGCGTTSAKFMEFGFDVVGCPAIQTYNATWMNLLASQDNVRRVSADIAQMCGYGVCVTTWECALFGAYDTLFPAIRASAQLAEADFLRSYLQESETYEEWARLMGVELAECGGTFTPGKIRSSLKVRLLLNSNPFLAWMHHGSELVGEIGDKALDVFERALSVSPGEATQGVTVFARSSVEFVRLAQAAKHEYAQGRPGAAISKLAPARQLFDDLATVATRNHHRIGGSLADIERCRIAKEHVERVIHRIKLYGDGSLGYLPAFEHITHPKFVPHDQAAWWLINRWANE